MVPRGGEVLLQSSGSQSVNYLALGLVVTPDTRGRRLSVLNVLLKNETSPFCPFLSQIVTSLYDYRLLWRLLLFITVAFKLCLIVIIWLTE